jgi:tRNA nucleotidyltransferase (CCA-adding enzyme)
VDIPPPEALIARVRALPAAVPLLERLGDAPPVYLVGGAVRDLLLGGTPSDLDLVLEGDATALAQRLGSARVHDRFGTSTVTLDGFTYDIARARTETYARPGSLPIVAPANVDDDLWRRDFTVNAIVIALNGARAGAVTAVSRALDDLEARRLRVLHDGSFLDDPTRLLRLARYAGRLGFVVEGGTRTLADAAVRAHALDTLTGSRYGAEIRLLAREPDPIAAFQKLAELGIDRAIEPGFGLADAALAQAALAILPSDERRDLLVLALAGQALPPSALEDLLHRLSFEVREREVIIAAATWAEPLAAALAEAHSPSQIAAAARGAVPELVALAGAHGPSAQAREWLEQLRHVRLEIDGHDLVRAGVPEGPAIGIGLQAALEAKLDGIASGAEAQLEHALRAAKRSG